MDYHILIRRHPGYARRSVWAWGTKMTAVSLALTVVLVGVVLMVGRWW